MSAEAVNELRGRVVAEANARIAEGKSIHAIHLSDEDAALIFSSVAGSVGSRFPEDGSTLVWGFRAFFGAPKTHLS